MQRLTLFVSATVFIFALFCISKNLAQDDTLEQNYTSLFCQSCHFSKIWQEWRQTTHAKSWSSSEFQKLAKKNPKGLECGSCHASRSVIITGLDKIPLLREKNRDFGISCIVCHLDIKEGRPVMHGPEPTKPPSIHGYVVRTPEETIKMCGTCHGTKELQSLCAADNNPVDMKIALENKLTCMQCHMPKVDKPRKRSLMSFKKVKDYKHVWLSHESSVYKDAVDLELEVEQNNVTLTVINKTSHSLPTEKGSKLKLVVNVKGDNGVLISSNQEEYAKDSKTQIKAGKSKQISLKIEQPFKKVNAELWYIPSPQIEKIEEFVVNKKEHETINKR